MNFLLFDCCSDILDDIAACKVRHRKVKPLPWVNDMIRSLRQECRCAERKWKKDKLQIYFIMLRDSLIKFQEAAKMARVNYFSDYFSPIEVKRGRAYVKIYGAILTFFNSRAVHLEMANSLNTDSCICALRKCMCRMGRVTDLISDNGTNFIGAE